MLPVRGVVAWILLVSAEWHISRNIVCYAWAQVFRPIIICKVCKSIRNVIFVRIVQAAVGVAPTAGAAIPDAVSHHNVVAGATSVLTTIIILVSLAVGLKKISGTHHS